MIAFLRYVTVTGFEGGLCICGRVRWDVVPSWLQAHRQMPFDSHERIYKLSRIKAIRMMYKRKGNDTNMVCNQFSFLFQDRTPQVSLRVLTTLTPHFHRHIRARPLRTSYASYNN